jgi:NAD(P)-dependent dehydrogenase (short-subunit alcohol dehydrogenase family)
VTGAGRGIGRGVAVQLAQRGYHVIAGVRDAARGEQVAAELSDETGGHVSSVQLEMSDPKSIAAAAEQVAADPGRLDVLVNNAGIGLDFFRPGTDPDFDLIEQTLTVNYYGPYRLTVALLPLLRAGGHGRIVNVSSGLGGVAEMGTGSPGYRASKAALNTLTRIFSGELAEDGVLVNSACPGFVNTDMGGPHGAKKPVEDAAAGIVHLATLPDDGPTGGFFRDGKPVTF